MAIILQSNGNTGINPTGQWKLYMFRLFGFHVYDIMFRIHLDQFHEISPLYIICLYMMFLLPRIWQGCPILMLEKTIKRPGRLKFRILRFQGLLEFLLKSAAKLAVKLLGMSPSFFSGETIYDRYVKNVYIYVYLYVYIYMYIYMYVCICIYIYIYVCVRVSVIIYECMWDPRGGVNTAAAQLNKTKEWCNHETGHGTMPNQTVFGYWLDLPQS